MVTIGRVGFCGQEAVEAFRAVHQGRRNAGLGVSELGSGGLDGERGCLWGVLRSSWSRGGSCAGAGWCRRGLAVRPARLRRRCLNVGTAVNMARTRCTAEAERRAQRRE
ncbi:hypothetical protein ASD51_30965 [Streptomyces sp. Root55]|nr:hypothetical protein ASD51_30965 [Streptomyces sp. Root55]